MTNSNIAHDPQYWPAFEQKNKKRRCVSVPPLGSSFGFAKRVRYWIVKSLRIDKAESPASVARKYEPRKGRLALQYIVNL
jgi:hypothetical protein